MADLTPLQAWAAIDRDPKGSAPRKGRKGYVAGPDAVRAVEALWTRQQARELANATRG